MGRKSKKTDRMYVTMSEYQSGQGGWSSGLKKNARAGESGEFKRLPFDCCSISLLPFKNPVCTADGAIFDIINILPFLKKYGTHPLTGQALDRKDLIKLHFHKNTDGQYICPITYKVFNENTKIVANSKTGHVYSMGAIDELVVKTKTWKDLITQEPFTRKDLIVLQDPLHLDNRNITKFQHMRLKQKATDTGKGDSLANINVDPSTRKVLQKLQTKHALETKQREQQKAEAEELRRLEREEQGLDTEEEEMSKESKGLMSGSLTSTVMNVKTINEYKAKSKGEFEPKIVGEKGYVSMVTNLGTINIELHCDLVPLTCENFIGLCENGAYDSLVFHRSIPNFMIQGGPTAKDAKTSIFGKAFPDEFHNKLQHSKRGIVAMANSGPNTNETQFYITYRACPHLDRKHSVFGSVVGGMEVLTAMEKVKTDAEDRPLDEIKVESVSVFVNPFAGYEEEQLRLRKERVAERKRQREEEERKKNPTKGLWGSAHMGDGPATATATASANADQVGKYMTQTSTKRAANTLGIPSVIPAKKRKKTSSGYGNFDNF